MALLSIVIPTFNEAGNVKLLAEDLEKAFSGIIYEIIFVDDGSPDGTADEIKKLPAFQQKIKLVERKGKLGLAGAVVEGAKQAKGDWILVMDADMSHSPGTARILFEKKGTADLIVASRNGDGGGKQDWPVSRDIISKGAEILCRPLIGNRTSDPLSGFFLVKKEIILNSKIRVKGYKILLNVLYDNPEISVLDIQYVFRNRRSGETKLDAKEIVNYLFDLGRIRFGSRH